MTHTEKYINDMYKYAKEKYNGNDIYDIYELKRLYNDIAEEFNLDIVFGIDGNEYGGDDEIYCYVYVDNIGSIVFDWSCKSYTDCNFYKDTVNYILELEKQGIEIKNKILNLNK